MKEGEGKNYGSGKRRKRFWRSWGSMDLYGGVKTRKRIRERK